MEKVVAITICDHSFNSFCAPKKKEKLQTRFTFRSIFHLPEEYHLKNSIKLNTKLLINPQREIN